MALFVLAVGATAIFLVPSFWIVMIANGAIAVVGDVFGPAVAAITLGLYRRSQLARRMGRNAAFDHAGNVAIAAAAGAVGWAISQRAVFMLVPIFAVLAAVAVLSIPAAAIDHDRARGGEPTDDKEHTPAGLSVLLTCRLLLVYAGCAMLFHFANAPLLPLVGQKLALAHPAWGTAMMSSCIIAAQIIMLPIAFLVGHTADTWGRKPILLIGFGILPLRAALYTFYERRHVADRSATAGGGWGGDFRRDHAPRPGRSDAWHRTLQCGSGSRRDGAGYWRVGKRIGRRVDC